MLGLFLGSVAVASPIVREPGAIYLADFAGPPIRLQVLEPAPVFFDLAGRRPVGTLPEATPVELVAVAGDLCRVRGQARHGPVVGWVLDRFLTPLHPGFIEALQLAEQRRRIVEELIANKEVAVGMTPAEVERSLGKPRRRSKRSEAGAARREVWEYVNYQTVPQQVAGRDAWGNPVVSTVYVRQAVGRLQVEFEGGLAAVVEESEDRGPGPALQIVPAPVILPGGLLPRR